MPLRALLVGHKQSQVSQSDVRDWFNGRPESDSNWSSTTVERFDVLRVDSVHTNLSNWATGLEEQELQQRAREGVQSFPRCDWLIESGFARRHSGYLPAKHWNMFSSKSGRHGSGVIEGRAIKRHHLLAFVEVSYRNWKSENRAVCP